MESNRLIIRRFTNNDFQDFSNLICDKMNSKYSVYDEQFPTDHESLKGILSFLQDSEDFWAIELKSAKRIIGFVSLNYVDEQTRNLGYCIHTEYQDNGFASEVVVEIIRYAREMLKIHKLISGTAEENEPSVKLLRKTGFTLVDKHKGSFVNDKQGNPIIFTGCSFEYIF